MQRSTEDLVNAAKLHDAEAFALLISRFEGIALSVAYAHAKNASDAADLVQESFLRAWTRLDSLDDPARFGHWLGRMVRNLAIDWRRRKRPGALDPEIDVAGPDQLPSPSETRERKQQVDEALLALDDCSRSCVTLRYYENLSSREIGELLDLSPAAVDMRLSRAREQLRDRLAAVVKD